MMNDKCLCYADSAVKEKCITYGFFYVVKKITICGFLVSPIISYCES